MLQHNKHAKSFLSKDLGENFYYSNFELVKLFPSLFNNLIDSKRFSKHSNEVKLLLSIYK